MPHDPNQWWPLTYDGLHVRHKDCGGWMYYQCDDTLAITAQACDRCEPGFRDHQYNLFDWSVSHGPNA